MKTERDALARVRESRHQISERFGHDPKRLVEYYIALQQQYKDRLVGAEEQEDSHEAAA